MSVSRTGDERPTVPDAVHAALRDRRAANGLGVVLAVSGGRDSMVLLHAASSAARDAIRAVATFDHGTGPHSVRAVAFVAAAAQELALPVVAGSATDPGRTEAAWRDARWRFLRDCARDVGAAMVATAHTRDDQCETVVMRVLRGASARGLAGLAGSTPGIVRPLASVSRADVGAYAVAHGVRWVDDPSNADRRHLRVRVRADLLPAIDRLQPGAGGRVIELAERAAAHRRAVDDWVTRVCKGDAIMTESLRRDAPTVSSVRVAALDVLEAGALALFWPAFAARAGVRLDRRAIARLVAFTPHAAARVRDGTVQPARIPIAGTGPADARGHVTLECLPTDASNVRREWQFVVRFAVAERAATLGMAAPRSSDYA